MSSLWIINKAGGLIFQSDHFVGAQKLTSNEALILAGTLHGIHAITGRLNPVPNTRTKGLETLEADNFKMTVLLTATGEIIVFIQELMMFAEAGYLPQGSNLFSSHRHGILIRNMHYRRRMKSMLIRS